MLWFGHINFTTNLNNLKREIFMTTVAMAPIASSEVDPYALMRAIKLVESSTHHSSSTVTMTSMHGSDEKLTALFQQSQQQASESALAALSEGRDLAAERKMRKGAKTNAKNVRKERYKQHEVFQVVLPEHKSISKEAILALRFSQDSISGTTQEGMKLDDLIKNMKEKGWLKSSAIKVVKMPDGTLVSLDNRRLYAAKEVCSEKEDFKIKIELFQHQDRASTKLLKGIIMEYKKGRKTDNINEVVEGIISNTYGHCAVLRINTRHGDLSSTNFGYTTQPTIRG